MLDAGVTQAGIAKELNVSRSFINQVVSKRRSTRRIREAIARAVGMPTEILWLQKRTAEATKTVDRESKLRK